MEQPITVRTALQAVLIALALSLLAPRRVEPQGIEPVRAPSVNSYGVAGMSQLFSAEPVGAGRVNLHLRGNLYQQDRAFTGSLREGAQITTASGGVAAGFN